MANALFAFDNWEAGHRAGQRLIDEGLPADAVEIHARPAGGRDTPGRQFDEQATGGLLTNLFDLFKGVFEWGSSPHDASAFEETVRRGGAVVSVDAKTGEQCEMVDEIMLAAGCDKHSGWSNAPTG